MSKFFKMKLRTNKEQDKVLLRASKSYMIGFNLSLREQSRILLKEEPSKDKRFSPISQKELLKLGRSYRKYDLCSYDLSAPFFDLGLLDATREEYQNRILPDGKYKGLNPSDGYFFRLMKEQTVSNDSFIFPEIGQIQVREKGHLPEEGKMGNTKVFFENESWWIISKWLDAPPSKSLEIRESNMQPIKGIPIMLDFGKDGALYLNGEYFFNLLDQKNYTELRFRQKKLINQADSKKGEYKKLGATLITTDYSKMIMHLQSQVEEISKKVHSIRKDYFYKVANRIVQEMKPAGILIPSEKCVRGSRRKSLKKWHQYEGFCLEFYTILLQQFRNNHLTLIFHEDGDSFEKLFNFYIKKPKALIEKKNRKDFNEKEFLDACLKQASENKN